MQPTVLAAFFVVLNTVHGDSGAGWPGHFRRRVAVSDQVSWISLGAIVVVHENARAQGVVVIWAVVV